MNNHPGRGRHKRWTLAGVAACIGVGISGHEYTPTAATKDSTTEARSVDTISDAREEIRRHVIACIDNATVMNGIPPLITCVRSGCVDGLVLSQVDASLPTCVSSHIRCIAKLLIDYPDLAPEIPMIANQHLSSLGALHPKRVAQPFLSSGFSVLHDDDFVRETSAQYLHELAKQRSEQVALD